MVDRIECSDASGARRSLELQGGTVHLAVRDGTLLATPEVGTASLRLVPTARGRRLEPVRPGGTVVVSGVELFCKDLAPGDTFVVDGLRATWRGDAPPIAVPRARAGVDAAPRSSSPSPRREADAEPRASRPVVDAVRGSRHRDEAAPASERKAPRPRPATQKALVFSLVSVAILLGVVALRWLDTQVGQHGPDELLTFARIQFDSGQFDRSLRTLDEAEAKAEGDARIRDAAARLREDVRKTRAENARGAAVQRARTALDEVSAFGDRYGGTSLPRPAARAFVRRVVAWEREHEVALRGAKDGEALLAQAASMRIAAEPVAAMATPDTAEDAVFEARAHLRFVVREYKAAVAGLEAFVRDHAGDELAQRELAAIRSEAVEWSKAQATSMQGMLSRGERDEVRQKFAQIEKHALLAECEECFAAVREALAQPATGVPR